MARLALLESFDTEPEPDDSGPGADWLAGWRTGLDEGRAAAGAEQARLNGETAQALADLAFTFREAQQHVLGGLTPLFRVIAERVVPHVLRETLGVALLEECGAAALSDVAAPVVLRTAPADAAPLAALIEQVAGAPFRVEGDPRLGPGQILIDRPDNPTSLDFDRLATDVADALGALCDDTPRRESHG